MDVLHYLGLAAAVIVGGGALSLAAIVAAWRTRGHHRDPENRHGLR